MEKKNGDSNAVTRSVIIYMDGEGKERKREVFDGNGVRMSVIGEKSLQEYRFSSQRFIFVRC